MEFFIFGSTAQNQGPKTLVKKLSLITGYAPLPPYYSLGFHYSKWEKISTERLHELTDEFTRNEMPYDVLWLDIEHTKDKMYFAFDEDRFANFSTFVDKMAD